MDSSAIIEQMNRESRGTLMASLGIEFTGIGNKPYWRLSTTSTMRIWRGSNRKKLSNM